MNLTVVTGYHSAGFREYGSFCMQSFNTFWPEAYRLIVYAEQPQGIARAAEERLAADIPELTAVQERCKANPYARGARQKPGTSWKAKDRQRGYSFRYDVAKFSKMALYTWHAAERHGPGLMAWLDGDVNTLQKIPADFFQQLLPDGYDVAYLGREPYHSETGFVLFRLPQALPVARAWAKPYITDDVFTLPEWHSAYVFDRARETCKDSVKCYNLSPKGRKHVFVTSPLNPYLDHLKGKRKEMGFSPERFNESRESVG